MGSLNTMGKKRQTFSDDTSNLGAVINAYIKAERCANGKNMPWDQEET